MRKAILVLLLNIIVFNSFAQKYTISGFISDSETGEQLIGSSIYNLKNLTSGTITNAYGFYSLTLEKSNIQIIISFIGYKAQSYNLNLAKDTVINFQLSPNIELEEVVVTGKINNVETTQMSFVDVPIKTIKAMPVLLGEVDVLKTIQMLPGVQSGTEGTSGIYVRGGGPDQNLILLDGVPVYNVNHLFGFFSVFNADAINDVTLIKGGFPARYGGRLSSVLDIRMKEGNMKEIKGEASIGLISSKFTIEGPLKKDTTAFIFSLRRTYIDILAAPVMALVSSADNEFDKFSTGYFFHDINAKINHKFSNRDRIYFSVYGGKDKAYSKIEEEGQDYSNKLDFDLHWGNLTTALRWNHIFSSQLFGNTTLTYSRYHFVTETKDEYSYSYNGESKNDKFEISYLSGIYDIAGKIDFDYLPSPNHKIKFGVSGIYHTFEPGVTALRFSDEYIEENIDTTFGSKNLYSQEYVAYVEDEIKIGSKLKVNFGGHFSGYNVRDTFFYSFQPRISARFLISRNWSIKAAYSKMQQNLHFLTNNTIGLPTDLWLPATDKITPQLSTQYAVGTNISINNQIDISVEGFYKEMDNIIEYKEGASFFGDSDDGSLIGQNWENKVEIGEGQAYGCEILLKKDLGKLSGWLGYTLSWTNRQFDNISFGEVFPYRYDRRHDISLVVTYKFNDRIDAGLTWVYGTGNAVTLAQERYVPVSEIDNLSSDYTTFSTIDNYGKRNNFRMPAYHRLDLGVNFSKEKKRGVRTWSISVYNAYNRKNPFFVRFEGESLYDYSGASNRKLMQYSLFPIIPSISYKFSF
ncbi:MAG: carboxypeptidase-like regulatory domain-containing protein [Bacteroidales bacterium]|jgi:outer membrane receptor for ferrienterochelin and colicin|nr:carboxypeptidase-like regulatory domain-containing protein [Bacteroidales bacterium]